MPWVLAIIAGNVLLFLLLGSTQAEKRRGTFGRGH